MFRLATPAPAECLPGGLSNRRHAPRSMAVPLCIAVLLGATSPPAAARVISYAPVTGATAYPAMQKRTNRHYALVEVVSTDASGNLWGPTGRLVLYDAAGQSDPRPVFPPGGGSATIANAAVFEGADGVPAILLVSSADVGGVNPAKAGLFYFSPDGGSTWRVLPFPKGTTVNPQFYAGWWMPWGPAASSVNSPVDSGGPIARCMNASIQVGSSGLPFVIAASDPSKPGRSTIFGITLDGSLQTLQTIDTISGGSFLGSNAARDRFVLLRSLHVSQDYVSTEILQIDGDGHTTSVALLPRDARALDGWIVPSGDVYLNLILQPGGTSPSRHAVAVAAGGKLTEVVSAPTVQSSPIPSAFGVPTADSSGAWIVRRQPGEPTSLYRHLPGGAPVEQWHDDTSPEVEAIHTGLSGQRLLVEVNRPRPQPDQRIFRDPALAIWEIGQPAPRDYDELFLREETNRSFVHLDVDAASGGDPFVFDSGSPSPVVMTGGPSGGAGGGGDVTQEWGVVRASLRQTLVVPSVARSQGMNGSFWRTDLILRNPSSSPVTVAYDFVPNGRNGLNPTGSFVSLVLKPNEIRVVPDLVWTLLFLESGFGAFRLGPLGPGSVEATTRTYTTTPEGTVGMGVGAVDLYTAVGPGFPVTFSGALQGNGFRTNVAATDTSARGTTVHLTVPASPDGAPAFSADFSTPAAGPLQVSDVAGWMGVPWARTSAVRFEATSGSAIPFLVVIDDRTNDPTYFPPDLPTSVVRTIPAIVHSDGADGAVFRSDLFLYNPSAEIRTVNLAGKLWNDPGNEQVVTLTLLAGEARRIVDPLQTIFGKSGVARLRVLSQQTGLVSSTLDGVRVTSRTYSVEPSGATRGLVMPPLNSFQSAGPGDTLEILGPVGGAAFRTNLSLVELSLPPSSPATVNVRVEVLDDKGVQVDAFTAVVPAGGGTQINDLFRSRGLGDGPAAALIRVSPAGGMVGAYATTIDKGTNDPSYFAANLGAK